MYNSLFITPQQNVLSDSTQVLPFSTYICSGFELTAVPMAHSLLPIAQSLNSPKHISVLKRFKTFHFNVAFLIARNKNKSNVSPEVETEVSRSVRTHY